jgi:hypothetical protein
MVFQIKALENELFALERPNSSARSVDYKIFARPSHFHTVCHVKKTKKLAALFLLKMNTLPQPR